MCNLFNNSIGYFECYNIIIAVIYEREAFKVGFFQMPKYSQNVYKQSQQECKLLQVIGGHFLLLCELIPFSCFSLLFAQ